ncbi:reverse transcriptase domain-containing protein [Tanacetum coccineum]
MKDPPGAIIVPISPLEKYLMPVSWPNLISNEPITMIKNCERLFTVHKRTVNYILVAVDCLSKWVEVKALPTNDARVVVKFSKSLFARFGTPRAIISDHGTYFCNDQFAKVMSSFVAQVLTEFYDYKERTKKLHDSKIKNRIFNVGDRVLLFNSRLKIFSGKLKTRWSGPFTITKVFPYRTIELSQPDGLNFKVNVHRVKHYFEGDLPPKAIQDLHTLSKDE